MQHGLCMPCLELFVASLPRNVGEELAEEGDKVGAAVATAQTKFISQVQNQRYYIK